MDKQCARCGTNDWPLTILRDFRTGEPVCERCVFVAGETTPRLYGHRHSERCAERRVLYGIG